nr:uncharacterized protein LOC109765999 [Aegilops tauschii subsp. strangulata]
MPPPDASMVSPSSTFRLHTDFLINFFRHRTRAKDLAARPSPPADIPRVFGCVVRTRHGPTVEIFSSLDLQASAARRHAFFEKKRKKEELRYIPPPVKRSLRSSDTNRKQRQWQMRLRYIPRPVKRSLREEHSPDLDVLGWYSTGTGREDTDTQEIHKALMMDDANNGTTGGRRDFYLLVVDHRVTDDFSSENDLRVTVYDCVLHATRPIFVKSNCTLEFLDHKGCFLCCPNRSADDYGENAPTHDHEKGGGGGGEGTYHHRHRSSRWTMLLETPSGFALFNIDARFLQHPDEIWPWFTRLRDARSAVSTLGFIKLGDNKSLAWDAKVGPREDLAKFILRFITTHAQLLIVPDPQLKYVIEKKLKVGCFFDKPTVHELTWGLNYVLAEFVPEERDNLTHDECHLPLSKELEKKIRAYGFNVSPQIIIDREFISIVGHLYSLEYISESLSVYLRRTFGHRFPGSHRMSDLEFAKAIADRLHSSEEMMIAKDDRYSKQDIVSFTDFILKAPELKNRDISRLKHMEAAASEGPLGVLDKKNPCLERMDIVASEDCFADSEQKTPVESWGKAEVTDKEPTLQLKLEAAASKPKALGKNKKGDDSNNDCGSISSEDDSKPETGKKRAAGSTSKMPASNKKAKVATQHRVARIRQAKRTQN